jgi:hypothetical protein
MVVLRDQNSNSTHWYTYKEELDDLSFGSETATSAGSVIDCCVEYPSQFRHVFGPRHEFQHQTMGRTMLTTVKREES